MFTSALRYTRLILLITVVSGAACKGSSDAAAVTPVDEANTAAREARGANKDLRASRTDLAAQSATGAVAVGEDVASKAQTDALFVNQRNTVLSDTRLSLRAIEEKLAALKANASTAKAPTLLAVKLDAAAAAMTSAAEQVEQLAVATPENWDARRMKMESSVATLAAAYTAAVTASAR